MWFLMLWRHSFNWKKVCQFLTSEITSGWNLAKIRSELQVIGSHWPTASAGRQHPSKRSRGVPTWCRCSTLWRWREIWSQSRAPLPSDKPLSHVVLQQVLVCQDQHEVLKSSGLKFQEIFHQAVIATSWSTSSSSFFILLVQKWSQVYYY